MRSRVFVAVLLFLTACGLLRWTRVQGTDINSTAKAGGPTFVKATAFGVSAELRAIVPEPRHVRPSDGTKVPLRTVNEEDDEEGTVTDLGNAHDADAAIGRFSDVQMPQPTLSFDGLSNFDNLDVYGAFFIPPDPIADVGPNHYVQSVNSIIRIFDKTGIAITPPFKFSTLLAALGTPCSTRNDGDPNVVYDPLADRWMISQFCTAFPPFRQMIAISKTGDPAGQYFVYEFVMPNVKLNDYPKLAVWPDGYYMSTDEFLGSDYVGSGAFAFERSKMLSGDPSSGYIYFNLPQAAGARTGGLLPSDLDGLSPPPAGNPNIFVGYTATEYGDAADALKLFEFHADFANPANSFFRERTESPITAAAFDPTSPSGRTDIGQPPPGELLDSVSDRLMFRIAYRNFGDHESLVLNQTVRVTPTDQTYRAGVRVYELRRTGSSPFSIAEQATVGDNTISRWLGAAAQDNQGNIAVAYSASNEAKKPAIVYSGRTAADPPGTLREETALVIGTGVQKAFGFRWGDYSGLAIDPGDDCSFWLTNEYFTLQSQEFSDFTWLTRVGKFKFDECRISPRSQISGTVSNAANGEPVGSVVITAAAYSRNSEGTGHYGPLTVVPGTYPISVSARGFRTQTASLTLANGQILVRDFALEPIPVMDVVSTEIVSESCNINHAAEPGESVTFDLSLRNAGEMPANNLTVALQNGGGISNVGPPQDYGSMPAGSSAVTRAFSFTVASGVACGAQLTLSFMQNANGQAIGQITLPLRAGEVRHKLLENFDRTRQSRLPGGWASSATGGEQPWRPSEQRSWTPTSSLFSPDPIQPGVNEAVSPSVEITTPTATLTFRNWYELETTFLRNRLFDGSVLEISTDNGPWQDIVAAGGSFESGGYDGIIDSCCQNPLAGRMGWSGRSGINQVSEFITSSVRLPPAVAGHSIRLRWRVGTDVGTFREGQYIDDVTVADGYSCSCTNSIPSHALFDFDGDGRTDISVFRPNDLPGNPDFIVLRSSNAGISSVAWGSTGDIAANADFDGDGKTDYAVFRPSDRVWYILRSSDQSFSAVTFGLTDDRPLPFDYDGDGKADIAVFRPSNGVWYWLNSAGGQFNARQFGLSEDLTTPGDFDGDGKADLAVFRPSTGVWYVARSSDAAVSIVQFGFTGDKPVAGDFDADGRADFVVYRPATGIWYMLRSTSGFGAVQFGLAGDTPLQADLDGDSQNDIAVFRPSTAVWYFIKSSDGSTVVAQFGTTGDEAVPSIFVEP